MNEKKRSTARDSDRDDAPDLSREGWPEKFAKATVRRGRPLVTKPKPMQEDRMEIRKDNKGQL